MAEMYGRAGIPVYRIIDVVNRHVEVYAKPRLSGYTSCEVLAPRHVLTVVIGGVEAGEIAVNGILPRPLP